MDTRSSAGTTQRQGDASASLLSGDDLPRELRCAINPAMTSSLRLLFMVALISVGLLGCPGPKPPMPPEDGGTDVTLAAPDAGFQYAIAPFEVAKGTETQRCFFVEIPSDVPVFVNRFEVAQNGGTH